MYLPLTNNPEESFNISINNIIYNFKQLWNTIGFWTIDIKDADGNILVLGVKLIVQENILKQYPHIDFDLISSAEFDPIRDNLDTFQFEVINKDA